MSIDTRIVPYVETGLPSEGGEALFIPDSLQSLVSHNLEIDGQKKLLGKEKFALQSAIVFDTVTPFLSIGERRDLWTYYVWAETAENNGEKPAWLMQAAGVEEENFEAIVQAVLGNEAYDAYYDQAQIILGLFPPNLAPGSYSDIAKAIADLVEQGVSREIIKGKISELSAVLSRERKKIEKGQKTISTREEIERIKLSEVGISGEEMEMFIRVATLKRRGDAHAAIATRVGVGIERVNDISKILISIGLISPDKMGKSQADRARARGKQVADLEEAGPSDVRLTAEEIGKELGLSERTVRRARARNDLANPDPDKKKKPSKKPEYEKHKAWRAQVREGVLSGLTNNEISRQYDIPFNTVKYHRANLVYDKEVPAIESKKAENRERLMETLDKYLIEHPGEIINLSALLRTGVFTLSYTSLYSLYLDIAEEREVPPIRHS